MSGEVPEGWRSAQLAEVATIKTGKTPSTRQPHLWGGRIPFVTPSDLSDSVWAGSVERHLTDEGALHSTVAPAGSVLFTCIASIGKACLLTETSAFNQQINACLPNPDMDADFLFFALKSRTQHLKDMAGTTAVPIINKTTFGRTKIAFPPVEEQRRIAEVLRSVDAAIRSATLAATQARRTYRHLITALTSPEDREGWTDCEVSDVCSILDSRRIPLNTNERRERKGSYPYWGANGIVDYIDGYIFDEPLVLMAEDGGYFGESDSRAICHRLNGKAWVNNHAHILRADEVNRDYLFFWFVHRDITSHIKGGTRTKLNQGDLKRLPISFPPLAQQIEIARQLDDALSAALEAEAVIARLSGLKASLSSDLLSGRVRVPA